MSYVYLLAWLTMAGLGVLNGVVREATYGKRMPEIRAHQLSSVILIAVIGFYVWTLTTHSKLATSSEALIIGVVWVALTVAFEFSFGRYVAGDSWTRLFRDYDVRKGRLWALVLLWLATAPYLFFRLQ